MRKSFLALLAWLSLCSASHALILGGQSIAAVGPPLLITPPAITSTAGGSPCATNQPCVTQSSSSSTFVGNTVTVSNGTWANCSSCTYTYQWYYYARGTTTQEVTTQSFAIPSVDINFWPETGQVGDNSVWAFVTVNNAFGSATAATPVTLVGRSPINNVGGGNLVICTDNTSACATQKPVDNTLAVGNWVSVLTNPPNSSGYVASGAGYLPPPISFTWLTSGAASATQAFNTVQTASTVPYQIASTEGSKLIKMQLRYNFNSPSPGGNVSGYNTFPAGPIVPASTPGATIAPPINVAVPPLIEQPTIPVITQPIQAYVGFVLTFDTKFTPGNWVNLPWNYTYDWRYCSTAPNSGIPAACGTTPNPAAQATGKFTFSGVPSNGDTIRLNGTTWTFVNTLTTGNQIQISAGNLSATLTNAINVLSPSTDVNTALMTYSATSSVINITAKVYSTAGNSYTISASAATASGPTLSGGLTASGASLTNSTSTGGVGYNYPVTTADLNRQIFARVTAYNTGGTTVQDGIPTQATINPSVPRVATNPSITGYATEGNVGGGTAGGQLVGNFGTWTGPPTNFSVTWYSCPPASPTCTNVATGPSIIHPLNVNTATLEPVYQVVPADFGNQIRLSVTAFNAASPLGVPADSNLSNTTTVFSQTPLAAGSLKVYPAGRDPLTTYNCAQPPTTYNNNWYVDNSLAVNGNGSSATPFNNFASALSAAHHGDRILLRGVAAWNSTSGQPGNYGTLSVTGTNVNPISGNTDWITIAADTGTSSKPMVTGINANGQGWNFDGIWTKGTGTFLIGSSGIKDFIYQNGFVGYYPDLATAESDYNFQCVSNSCGYNSIGEFLNGFNSLPAHVVNTGFGPRTAVQCWAITNNKIWFTTVGISILFEAQDVLLENNDIAYFTVDAVDFSTWRPVIAHLNNIHDPISPLNPNSTPHQDAFQTQPFINLFDQGEYGLEIDSNFEILNEDAAFNSFVDQPYCTAHGLSPCSSNPVSIVGDESCFQQSNNFSVGTRFVNNMCLYTAQTAFAFDTLATFANNTILGWNQLAVRATPQVNEVPTLGFPLGNYWANNAADNFQCYSVPPTVGTSSGYANNVIIPLGTASPTTPGGNCPVGWGVVDSSGNNPFTATVANGPTALVPLPSAFVTAPSTINLIPPGPSPGPQSSLYQSGLAGFNVPTVTINGTASTSPPNVGAY